MKMYFRENVINFPRAITFFTSFAQLSLNWGNVVIRYGARLSGPIAAHKNKQEPLAGLFNFLVAVIANANHL